MADSSWSDRTLLLGTGNAGKRAELEAMLQDFDLRLVPPADRDVAPPPDESGADYLENATLKAVHYAQTSGFWALADDSGLEVDALGGEPGLRSARLAGSDEERRQLLLQRLHSHPRPWSATFRSVVVLASPGGPIYSAEGSCPGEIVPDARGESGFGYDPIFLVHDQNLTMAELDMSTKNRLSHRARAVAELRPILEKLLG